MSEPGDELVLVPKAQIEDLTERVADLEGALRILLVAPDAERPDQAAQCYARFLRKRRSG